MKIGIDARLFTTPNFTGISRSVHEIIKMWAQKYPEHEYYLLSRRPIHLEFELPKNWHIVNTPWIIDKGKLWAIFELPKLIKELNLDVFWGTNYSLPRKVSKNTKYYVTVYDLALFKFKGIGATRNTIRLKLFAKSACKKAEKVIAISKATAKDITEIFKIPKSKISVSYCGGLPTEFSALMVDCTKEVNPVLKFNENFLLFISTIEPRKNIITIIKSFEKYIDDTGENTKLVLAGRRGWKCDEIYDVIKKSKYRNRIIMPGFISDKDKAYLLSNAKAFVYPSLYEGFGIPILEAFAYGVPVLTAKISSMPEVGGDAAYYIENPTDINGLANLMKHVVNLDDNERKKIQERMKRQLRMFSWEKNANEMMEIFVDRYENNIN